jgi:hypothetical protein
MGFEVFTAVKMSMLAFWVVTPCGLVSRYHFRGTYCNSALKMEAVCSSKTLVPAYKFTWPHIPEDHGWDKQSFTLMKANQCHI